MKNYLIEFVRDAPRLGIWLGVSILVLCGMVGCSSSVSPSEPGGPIPHTTYDIDGYFTVTEFRLTDGTRCVAVGGNTGRGITCEWRAAH